MFGVLCSVGLDIPFQVPFSLDWANTQPSFLGGVERPKEVRGSGIWITAFASLLAAGCSLARVWLLPVPAYRVLVRRCKPGRWLDGNAV